MGGWAESLKVVASSSIRSLMLPTKVTGGTERECGKNVHMWSRFIPSGGGGCETATQFGCYVTCCLDVAFGLRGCIHQGPWGCSLFLWNKLSIVHCYCPMGFVLSESESVLSLQMSRDRDRTMSFFLLFSLQGMRVSMWFLQPSWRLLICTYHT